MARAARFAATTSSSPFDVDALFKYLLQGKFKTAEYQEDIEQVRELVKDNTVTPLDAASQIIKRSLKRKERSWQGCITVGVGQSSLWALDSACKSPDSFVECMKLVICPGGDVDSTAAMAGGIVGARLGMDAIPVNWVQALHDLDEWDTKELIDLAARAGGEGFRGFVNQCD